ncbi:MAG TPA: glycosyltransferase family 2 protein [bacterium]|nr:glycosyltransferase family 2 protein [bacterium]
MTVWVLIPARDEEQRIAAVITAAGDQVCALGHVLRVLVVNDGSRDATAKHALATPHAAVTEVITLPASGIGAVFNAGISAVMAGADDEDCLVIMEGDGTSDPTVLSALIAQLNTGAEVVIASRLCTGGAYRNFGRWRWLQSWLANRLFQLTAALPGVHDYTIFYRAYRLAAVRRSYPEKRCCLRCGGFEANTELLLQLAAAGAQVAEVPLCYDYAGKCGTSKLPTMATVLGHLSLLVRVVVVRKEN